MARIIYGVMGDSGGHISRALAMAHEMPEHEFLFVGGGTVASAANHGYRYFPVPLPGTLVRDNRVRVLATAANFARIMFGYSSLVGSLCRVIEDFKPDLAVTDYEFFLPRAARQSGLKCVSFDHLHVITHCSVPRPPGERLSRLVTTSIVDKLFSNADAFIVTALGDPAPGNDRTVVVPPVLRRDTLDCSPSDNGHILVYLRSGVGAQLRQGLASTGRECRVFGTGGGPDQDNLRFFPPSRDGFLESLASCSYVICNGGYNLTCEALHMGKPVLAFPTAFFYEQYFNGHELRRLGYGDYARPTESVGAVAGFEKRLDGFAENLSGADMFGNEAAVRALTAV